MNYSSVGVSLVLSICFSLSAQARIYSGHVISKKKPYVRLVDGSVVQVPFKFEKARVSDDQTLLEITSSTSEFDRGHASYDLRRPFDSAVLERPFVVRFTEGNKTYAVTVPVSKTVFHNITGGFQISIKNRELTLGLDEERPQNESKRVFDAFNRSRDQAMALLDEMKTHISRHDC